MRLQVVLISLILLNPIVIYGWVSDDDGSDDDDESGSGSSKPIDFNEVKLKLASENATASTAFIYNRNSNNIICSGVLIDKFAIITVAHCFLDKNQTSDATKADEIYVKFVRKREESSRIVNASEIFLHPKWMREDYDADLAIVKLAEEIQISSEIFPAILPEQRYRKDHSPGYLIGLKEGSNTTLYEAELIAVDTCPLEISTFRENSICASRTSIGNSGSGFFRTSDNGSGLLYGIIVIPPSPKNEDFVLYTVVSRFSDWIKVMIGPLDFLKCSFQAQYYHHEYRYACRTIFVTSVGKNNSLKNVTGTLYGSKKTKDVDYLKVYSQEYFNYIPADIGIHFPRLWRFAVQSSSLYEIEQDNFRNMENLEQILLQRVKIKTIPARVFSNVLKLKTLDVIENQLSSIHSEAFDGIHNLQELRLNQNELKTVNPQWLKNLPNLQIFSANKNQITHLETDLFVNNPKLIRVSFSYNQINKIDARFDNLPDLSTAEFIKNMGCITGDYGSVGNYSMEQFHKDVEERCR